MADNLQSKETETECDFSAARKHPLQNCWKLWYKKNEKNKDWKDCLTPVYSFATVEDFWSIYNHIELASNLQVNCDYAIFKEGIVPMWEDPHNNRGGRWMFSMMTKSLSPKHLDDMWLEVILLLIGEGFGDASDEVCGAVISLKQKMVKIALWARDINQKQVLMKIGKIMKARMQINEVGHFESHSESQSRHGSKTNWLYSV